MWTPSPQSCIISFYLGIALLLQCCNPTVSRGESSCVNRCNSPVNPRAYTCQCNSQCQRFGDCCSDYATSCLGSRSASSCANRCHSPVETSQHTCQCNSHCQRFGDCCGDYADICLGPPTTAYSCLSWSQIGQALWDSDVNKMDENDVTLNFQSRISDYSTQDKAPHKLFTHVNTKKLTAIPTYRSYLALLDNYNPVKGHLETETFEEKTEVDRFLRDVVDTKVMDVLLRFLQCEGSSLSPRVSDKASLRATIYRIWFTLYKRSPYGHHSDTSGFEHMMGEYKNSSVVNGFHSWLSFYEKEKEGVVNYMGYVSKDEPGIIGAAFRWNGRLKSKGTFFIGVSPEFDLATYTLCFLFHPGKKCTLIIDGTDVDIQTYSNHGGQGEQLATAFILG